MASGYLVVAMVLVSAAFQGASAQAVNKGLILQQARQSYYSLRAEHIEQCRCKLLPDWQSLLADLRKSNPDGADYAVKKLSTIRFTVSVDSDGNANVTHNEVTEESQQMADALRQIYGGMEQMISGFFTTWSVYMMSPALPKANDDYQLTRTANGYRIQYKEGTTDIITDLRLDYSISNQKVVSPEFTSTLQPHFRKTPGGFILVAYEATYDSGNPAEETDLQVVMDYQEVNGLQWPNSVDLTGTYGGTPFQVNVIFTGCTATKSE
jgi:hypothetical protein